MVSITLITIALLGVMGSVAYGSKHSRSGEELSEATHLARSILNYVQETTLLDTADLGKPWPTVESGLNDSPEQFRQLDDPPLTNSMRFETHQLENYRRRIQSIRVSNDPLNYRKNLAQVRVTIFWTGKQGERQVNVTGLVTHARDL